MYFVFVLFISQLLQVFDSHAGALGYDMFCQFCLPYLRQIATEVKEKLKAKSVNPVPMVSYCHCYTVICLGVAHDLIGIIDFS